MFGRKKKAKPGKVIKNGETYVGYIPGSLDHTWANSTTAYDGGSYEEPKHHSSGHSHDSSSYHHDSGSSSYHHSSGSDGGSSYSGSDGGGSFGGSDGGGSF